VWELLSEYREYVVNLVISALGGVVRALNSREFSVLILIKHIVSGVFVGIIATLILTHSDMPETMKTAIAGTSGYAANDILQAFTPWVKKRLGL
jgi:hypothetical protein